MIKEDIALFNDSFLRCQNNSGFLDRFYELFLASSPKVKNRFRNTDFEKQKMALKSSFYMMMLTVQGNARGQRYLEEIADLHSRRRLDIKPEMYDLWVESLLGAVKEFDPKFDEGVERVWRSLMNQGISFMKSRY
jgi:hemoglobin-like flavoprotein